MIGKRLKDLRAERGLPQDVFASCLGVKRSTLSMYEADKRNPSYTVLIRLARYFEVTTDYLLGLTDER